MSAFCELTEARDKMEVHFRYDPIYIQRVKTIPGARFVPRDKGGPHWTVPLTMTVARRLREVFGNDLQLGAAVRAWGKEQVQVERNLASLTTANDAQLSNLRANFAEYLRAYQRADVAMMAAANVLNANQPGTGKTVEVLAAIEEAGLLAGAHLICAPVRSLENVWAEEIEKWMPGTVYACEDAKDRHAVVTEGMNAIGSDPVWICVNPDMLRLKRLDDDDVAAGARVFKRDHKGQMFGARNALQERLLDTDWNTFTIDEFHKAGLNSTTSLFKHGVSAIKAGKRYALSGTPMGGKPIKLFPVLQWLEPGEFTSKWRWVDTWLDVTDNGYGKKIGGIRQGREEEFYAAHTRYMVRRLKREALPGLPEQVHFEVKCPMTPKQEKQYRKFEKDSEVAIADAEASGSARVIATCILAEYTRLKQFANAYCEFRGGDVMPTTDSGKLPHLLEKLDEFGVRKDDPEPGARAIVASQSKRMVNMVAAWLRKEGIDCDELTGDTKDSRPIVRRFQDGSAKPYVIVMTTQTGGVSLNLEAAGSVHILDESWNPDDEEQLADRGDRGSRTTALTVLTYRTRGTVQQYIAEVAQDKKITNANVLDVYRRMAKERTA